MTIVVVNISALLVPNILESLDQVVERIVHTLELDHKLLKLIPEQFVDCGPVRSPALTQLQTAFYVVFGWIGGILPALDDISKSGRIEIAGSLLLLLAEVPSTGSERGASALI